MGARRKVLLMVVAMALCAGMPRTASAIYIRHDVALANYMALAADPLYAATGYLRSASGTFCSATLIGPTTVLSAAHCFVFAGGPRVGEVALPSDVMFGLGDNVAPFSSNITNLELNPHYDITDFSSEFDMAILTVSGPFTGVTPALIWAGDPFGLTATIIGYGSQGTGLSNVPPPGGNQRLAAQNTIDSVLFDSIRFDFDSLAGDNNRMGSAVPVPLEGTPATGDSGGPLFALLNGSPFLVGTLTGGIGNNLYGDLSVYSRVAREENLQFLAAHGITPASPIPEPGTLGLILLGLTARWSRRRGRPAS